MNPFVLTNKLIWECFMLFPGLRKREHTHKQELFEAHFIACGLFYATCICGGVWFLSRALFGI